MRAPPLRPIHWLGGLGAALVGAGALILERHQGPQLLPGDLAVRLALVAGLFGLVVWLGAAAVRGSGRLPLSR